MQQSHEQPPESKQPRSRLTKATASTAAIQPLEITMTAVVTTPEENTASSSSIDGAHSSVERLQQYQQAPSIQQQQQHSRQQQKVEQQQQHQQQHQQQSKRQDARRKQSQHRHHVKSPVFTPDNSVSPLLTPSPNTEAITFPTLPPPAKSSTIPSEAVVALQDAANGKYQAC